MRKIFDGIELKSERHPGTYDEPTVFSAEELATELNKLSSILDLLGDLTLINMAHEDLVENVEDKIRKLMQMAINVVEVYK